MDKAKEALHKMSHPGGQEHDITQGQPQSRMDTKQTQVQMETSESDTGMSAYVPSGKLKGKRALITGGDSGIGRAISIMFAMEGARLAIVYLPQEEQDAQHTKAQVEKNGGEVLLIPEDLSQAVNTKGVVERAQQALGGIDILVNNAATRKEHASMEDITDSQWSETFRTNLDSYFHMTKYALPYMNKGSVIINSASVDSYIGVPSRLDYTTSKGAIIAFTRGLSNELVKKGIRVNAVAAGPVSTPLMATGVSKEGQHGHGLSNWTPMNQLGKPSEITTNYVFLAYRDSEFMSGQTLHPNGGIVVNG
ncbi:NAD(P)-binding protein [Xylaria cubensis]|nr:NAD(P)-binding protein [Xylaria cubensis]